MSRKLATIRRISALNPIAGADRIEVAVIDGWEVIVKKGDFTAGDLCIYLEIDSWVPHSLAPFLTGEGKEPKDYKGIKGQRLRTVKMRGQLSQGLVLPIIGARELAGVDLFEDLDISEKLGVIKWESEVTINTTNFNTKLFPTDLFPKTDQERIQNCYTKLPKDHTWEATLKLDGSSCTIFCLNGELRVCSRNLEIAVYTTDPLTRWEKVKQWFGVRVTKPRKVKSPDNQFVKMALQVEEQVKRVDGYAFQGELMGPLIQGNREGFKQLEWFVYDIVDTKTRRKLTPQLRHVMCKELSLQHVPVLNYIATLPESVKAALDYADSLPSVNHKVAEGVVYKSTSNPELSFKAISNNFLLGEK